MGIAESISAVGIAGTVTGLSYTQATAQQKEEEEEAKRAADEAAQAAAPPTRNNNRHKQRAGADENGPSRGAFPVSGTLGGGGNGRGPGPGRQKGGGTTAADTGGRQDGGNRNTTGRKDGRSGTGKQRAPTEQSNRPNSASQKKEKKNDNRRNQLPSAAEDNVPSSDAQNPPTTVTQSTTPVKGQRRAGGISKKQNASSVPSQTANETEKPAIDSGAVATVQEQTAPPAAVDNKSIARPNRRKNGKSRSNTRAPQSSTTSPSSATNTASATALSPPPAQNTSTLHPHPLSNPQVPRNESRARSRKPRGHPHTKVDTVAPSQLQSPSSQIVQNPSKTQDHPAATNPVVSPNPSQARRGKGKGKGSRRANVERSTPLVSSSQLNHPTTEDG